MTLSETRQHESCENLPVVSCRTCTFLASCDPIAACTPDSSSGAKSVEALAVLSVSELISSTQ